MDNFEDPASNSDGVILSSPISIGDLTNNGSAFEVNVNFNKLYEDELLNDMFPDDDDLDEETDKQPKILTPWEKSFNEMRPLMVKINNFIYKRVTTKGIGEVVPPNARILIHYNSFWEHESEPFDSTYLRKKPLQTQLGVDSLLRGIEESVQTMRSGEESQFIISYHLLYREMGCPPRIKPKADGLFVIKLLKFTDVGNSEALELVNTTNRNKYAFVKPKAIEVYVSAVAQFKFGNIANACKLFHKAVNALDFCHMANEDEEKEQRELLLKYYTNLAVCYLKLNKPTRTCSMCKEIRRFTNIKQNCKALFLEGKALRLIGNFSMARKLLLAAQHLEPQNKSIANEMLILSKQHTDSETIEKNIWKKALGIVSDKSANDNKEKPNLFTENMKQFLEDFKNNSSAKSRQLPSGLIESELSITRKLAMEMSIDVVESTRESLTRYTLVKI